MNGHLPANQSKGLLTTSFMLQQLLNDITEETILDLLNLKKKN